MEHARAQHGTRSCKRASTLCGAALTQDVIFEITTTWWDSKWGALSRKREALASEAQEAAEDPELQGEIIGHMNDVLTQIRLDLIPLILLMQVMLSPLQLAE